MFSTVVAQGSQWILRGFLAGGLLCGVALAAPPTKEKAKPAPAVAAKPSVPKPEPAAQPPQNANGGSVLGSLVQLFTGGPPVVPVRAAPFTPAPVAAPAPVRIVVDGEEEQVVAEESQVATDELKDEAVPVVKRPGKAAQPWNLPGATHHQTLTVKIAQKRGNGLQTFCVTPAGQLVAVVGPPRHGAAAGRGKAPTSELHVFDGDGNPLKNWTVEFVVQAVTSAPDGTIVAAGSGQVAKFTAEGELVKQMELQHVKEALGDPEKLRKGAEELIEAQRAQLEEFFKTQTDELQTRIDELKAAQDKAEEGKFPKAKARQLAAAERSLKHIVQQKKQMEGRQSVEDVIRDLTSRLKIVNAVTATNDDVFLACGVMNGYGYAVWRMTPDFEEPKQIITGLSGCCGQMDIQCQGSELYVAENSRHRVACYNRDGKQLRTFGNREGQKGGQFGGCCNPMNLCFDKDGSVLTAESEGIVRKFTATGQALGAVGGCKLTGGCKNVAIGMSPDGEKVYFCDLPGSQIIVMARNAEEPDEAKPAEAKPAERSAKKGASTN